MKLKLFTIGILLLSFTKLNAQEAKTILDNAAVAYSKAGGIDATFKLEVKEQKTGSVQIYKGTAKMKGDKFRINMNEVATWFDGKTQWVYIKETNEVNVTEPTGEELQGVNPSSIFSIYQKGYELKYNWEKNMKGTTVQQIEMIPQSKDSNFSKILVQVNKTTKLFSQIIASDKNGYTHILSVTQIKTGVNIPDSDFTFNASEYPQAEIIDLR